MLKILVATVFIVLELVFLKIISILKGLLNEHFSIINSTFSYEMDDIEGIAVSSPFINRLAEFLTDKKMINKTKLINF